MNSKYLIITALLIAAVVGFMYFTKNKSTKTATRPAVQDSKEVSLKNGDTYTLTASIVKKTINGKQVQMLAYNGSIPGPVIRVPQDAEITINLKNETDISTSLHSHGIRMENKFDGAVGVTQEAIKVGDSFTYKLTFPDAGAYWYHPHFREDYAQPAGLYGMFLVTPKDPDYYSAVNREETIMISDVAMTEDGLLPYDKETVDHTLMGRYGNVFLVNGSTDYRKSYGLGEIVRFHIANASATRVYNLTIPGAQMKLVSSDGGKYTTETFADSVVLSPSERATVDVQFGKPGRATLQSVSPAAAYNLATFTVSDELVDIDHSQAFGLMKASAEALSGLDSFDALVAAVPDKTLSISLDMAMGGMDHSGHSMGMMTHPDGNAEKIEWEDGMRMMNATSTKETVKWRLIDEETKQENMNIHWSFKKGDQIKIRVVNKPDSMHPMQHPMHVHGQRMMLLSTNDVANDNPVWKDTVLVQTGDTADILVEMSNPGDWMFHCHIPEHMESGMMGHFKVL